MLPKQVRAAIVVLVGAFFVLGPIHPQVFMGPARTSDQPWRPMQWHMYHNVGLDNCQGNFWAIRDGQRVEYTRRELTKALPRIRGGGNTGSRWDAGRQVREYDVVWNNTHDVKELARLICEREPDHAHAEVHAYARCAPGFPGGRWKEVADGTQNMCVP